MSNGRVTAIHIAAKSGEMPAPIDVATMEVGLGIRGDRNWARAKDGGLDDPGEEVTFIEQEALDAIRRENGMELSPAESRRNILTEGVALNHLVGRRFRVGGAEFEGVELCEPCGYLEKMTFSGVVKALLHRGGLRARVVTGGDVRPGDEFEAA